LSPFRARLDGGILVFDDGPDKPSMVLIKVCNNMRKKHVIAFGILECLEDVKRDWMVHR
jgi:hypothetical protein